MAVAQIPIVGGYRRIGLLGKGTFGEVWRGQHIVTNELAAVKEIKIENDQQLFKARQEVKILMQLSHPNIVQTFGSVNAGKKLFIIMQLGDQTLHNYLRGKHGLPHLECRHVIYQILRALQHCHRRNIIHRDVSTANLLRNNDGRILLADFGLAKRIFRGSRGNNPRVVTCRFRSPDLFMESSRYHAEIDIWALGCVAYQIITGETLFPQMTSPAVKAALFLKFGKPTTLEWPEVRMLRGFAGIPDHERKSIIDIFPDPAFEDNPLALNFLHRMMTMNPALRISSADALRHPYFYKNLFLRQGGPERPCHRRPRHAHTDNCTMDHDPIQSILFGCQSVVHHVHSLDCTAWPEGHYEAPRNLFLPV